MSLRHNNREQVSMATKKAATKKAKQDYEQLKAQEALERTVFRTVQDLMRDMFKEYGLTTSLNVGALMFAIAEERHADTLSAQKAVAKAVLAECSRVRKNGFEPEKKPKVKRKAPKKAVKRVAKKKAANKKQS
jgi:hypothetical protein